MPTIKTPVILCIAVTTTLGLSGCGGRADYRKTVESAAQVLSEAVEMERLFGKGKVDHFIEHFGMGDERWNSEVHFGGRYSLTMQVYVDVDHRRHVIRPKGEPIFYLVEYHRVDILDDGRAHAHSGNAAGLAKHDFSSDQWAALYASGGDLAVLGVKENKAAVPNFEELVRQVRRDRKPVISLLPEGDSNDGNERAKEREQ